MSSAQFYPVWFHNAAVRAWGPQATTRLSGGKSSTQQPQEPSAEAARHWLRQTGHNPFLNEIALRSIVFANSAVNRLAEASKAVDWVATTTAGTLVLVEAKSTLDSAGVGSCLDGRNKFSVTIDALRAFAQHGQQQMPRLHSLHITAKAIEISGRSSWSVPDGGGPLQRNGAPTVIEGIPVHVRIVPFADI